MNIRTIAMLAALTGLAACSAPATDTARAASYTERTLHLLQNPPPGVAMPVKVENRLYSLLNDLRQKEGLSLLKPRRSLQDAARVHSLRMVRDGFFGHTDPDGRSASNRVAAVDRQNLYSAVAENLAQYGPVAGDMAAKLQRGWANSPGHYKTMISPRYTHVGIACVQNARGLTCAQVYGKAEGHLLSRLPARLRTSGQTSVAAQTSSPNHAGWRLVDKSGIERVKGLGDRLKWPKGLKGEFYLRIVGTKQEGNRVFYYPFFGPSVVLD